MALNDLSEADWFIAEPLFPAVGKVKRRVDGSAIFRLRPVA